MKNKDLTTAQRLVKLYMQFVDGAIISPTVFGRECGVSRQAVYHAFDQLSGMGIPIVRYEPGKWVHLDVAEKLWKIGWNAE